MRFINSAPATTAPLIGPDVEVTSGAILLRHSLIEPASAGEARAVMIRRGADTLLVELRSRQKGIGIDLIWRKDYEVRAVDVLPGAYVLSWWHVIAELNPARMHILDTTITIP